jgi:opacity protein-like surface antigen
MKISKLVIAMVGMMAISTGVAQAGSIQDFNPTPYVGIGLGVYGLHESEPGYSQNNDEFGGYVNAGVNFNDYLGLELRVGTATKGSQTNPAGTLGVPTVWTADLQADYLISYLAKLQYPVNPQFNVRAMLGATTAHLKATLVAAGVAASNSATHTGFSYGLGADYNVNSNLTAGVEWLQYWTDETFYPNSKATLWSVVADVGYHF